MIILPRLKNFEHPSNGFRKSKSTNFESPPTAKPRDQTSKKSVHESNFYYMAEIIIRTIRPVHMCTAYQFNISFKFMKQQICNIPTAVLLLAQRIESMNPVSLDTRTPKRRIPEISCSIFVNVFRRG